MLRFVVCVSPLLLASLACSCVSETTGGSAESSSLGPDVRSTPESNADPADAAADAEADAPSESEPASEQEDAGQSDAGAEPDTTAEVAESDPGVGEDAAVDPALDLTPGPCSVHSDCGGSALCSEGVCIDPLQIDVATAADWDFDPYTTLIAFCPDAPEELREVNPVISPGFPRDVETPDGPGVQSQGVGTTEWCCGCALTLRRFELPPIETEGVLLSFWFDSGFIGDPGPWNQPTLGVLLLNGDDEVGSVRFSQFEGRYSNCPYEDVYEPAKAQRIRLDELYDGVIDAIVMEMGHYACVGTNFVTLGPLTVTR